MNSNQATSEHNELQFYRQYSANALLPELNWQDIFVQSNLDDTHLKALNTLYQAAVSLALNVFHELNFDVFAPAAYQPQGLGLFEKLALQEQKFLDVLETESAHLDHETRHQILEIHLGYFRLLDCFLYYYGRIS